MKEISNGRLEAVQRAVAGLIEMSRLSKERIRTVEQRCDRLEQAALELAEALRKIPA